MGLRVLVCGGRDYPHKDRVWLALDRVHAKHGISLVIEDRCYRGGADLFGQQWAEAKGIDNLGYPMDRKLGRAGGPIRNRQMRDEGRPDAALAFGGGDGTSGMVALLNEANIPVWEIDR